MNILDLAIKRKNRKKLIDSILKDSDDFINNEEDKQELKRELEELLIQNKTKVRKKYKEDSSLQESFAVIFLVCYMLLSLTIIIYIFTGEGGKNLQDWASSLIILIFTAMSTKVATICDFLFGAGKAENRDRSYSNYENPQNAVKAENTNISGSKQENSGEVNKKNNSNETI